MSNQEQAFFEVWDKIEAHSDLYNHRMMFDLGYKAAEERIIKLLEAECDCDFFEKYEIPSRCYAHKHTALIKGEK